MQLKNCKQRYRIIILPGFRIILTFYYVVYNIQHSVVIEKLIRLTQALLNNMVFPSFKIASIMSRHGNRIIRWHGLLVQWLYYYKWNNGFRAKMGIPLVQHKQIWVRGPHILAHGGWAAIPLVPSVNYTLCPKNI